MADAAYTYLPRPDRRCDIVMKGGITSGVVYPRAICALAEKFRIQNIGGTSAGAIAAAAAAAAEYGRRLQSGAAPSPGANGFAQLEQLGAGLGANPPGSDDSTLFNLFQPTKETRGLFALLVAAISNPAKSVPIEVGLSALRNWWLWGVLGASPGVGLLALFFFSLAHHGWPSIIALLLGSLASIALAAAGSLGFVLWKVKSESASVLSATSYGICTGMPADGTLDAKVEQTLPFIRADRPLALTEWLHELLKATSGKEVLTFGDLWGSNGDGPRELDLAMITTSLTFGRPYRLPFELSDALFFNADELRQFFPKVIVTHLVDNAGPGAGRPDELLPLPSPDKLPVLFAARLSLSFPLLLSAIPLHYIDAAQEPQRCLFSDGGICSNFPIEFFDSPLPRWPTFGIDLGGEIGADGEGVRMAQTNRDTIPRPTRKISSLMSFAAGIGRSAQNWHDNQFVELPGFRDRIVEIEFHPNEGGLNLNMPPALISGLADRGEQAGRELAAHFVDGTTRQGQPIELTWNNHRRIRLRDALAALEGFAVQLAVGYTGNADVVQAPRRFLETAPPPGEDDYASIAATDSSAQYGGLDGAQQALALRVLAVLVPSTVGWATARGRDLGPQSPSLMANAPQPPQTLNIGPRI